MTACLRRFSQRFAASSSAYADRSMDAQLYADDDDSMGMEVELEDADGSHLQGGAPFSPSTQPALSWTSALGVQGVHQSLYRD